MNGLYLPARSDTRVLTATGQLIPLTSDNITDVWCGTGEEHAALLDFWQSFRYHDPAYFSREDADTKGNVYRVHAHLNTANGRVFVHRSDLDEWGPLRGIPAVRSLRLLDRLARILGVRALHYSPLSRGLSMVDFTRGDNPDWFGRELPPNWGDLDHRITPNFTRKQSDYKMIGSWLLHKYDVRAAWLASARTVKVGYGAWVRLPKFDPKQPGIWPVTLPKSRVDPGPIMVSGWYETERVRAALDWEQDITIAPGQGWEHAAACLRPFCENLTRARSQVATEGENEAEQEWITSAIKLIYTQTFGAIGAYRPYREKLYQPHWEHALKAESARRMWKLYQASPYIVGIETDAIYAVAPRDVDPFSIVPGASPIAYNAGHVRYEGNTPVTREMYDLFGGGGDKVRKYLDKRNCLEPWGGEAKWAR